MFAVDFANFDRGYHIVLGSIVRYEHELVNILSNASQSHSTMKCLIVSEPYMGQRIQEWTK